MDPAHHASSCTHDHEHSHHDHAPPPPPSATLADVLRNVEVKHESFHHHDPEGEVATLAAFRGSQAFVRVASLAVDLCDAVAGGIARDLPPPSDAVTRLLATLEALDAHATAVEPAAAATRFGNPAFKTLVASLRAQGSALLNLLLGPNNAALSAEDGAALLAYLLASLGDEQRVDYGTGHELSFLAFMAALRQCGVVQESDLPHLGLSVLARYFTLVRRLQVRYHLEPAGSRGCWGLDDYQFLPFLVGAAQLTPHPRLRPKSVLDAGIREAFAADFMYMAAIAHVHALKVCSFAEHSPMLYDITLVKDWTGVRRGLLSMYNREVLGKHTIVQHFAFSHLLPRDAAPPELLARVEARMPVTAADQRLGPIVAPEQRVINCCDAIRLPSTIGAK